MTTAFVTIGDSLTEHGTWPALVCAATGWNHIPAGRAGQTSTEIALRVGALPLVATVAGHEPGGLLRVRPRAGRGEFRAGVPDGMADIAVRGHLDGRPGILRHPVAAGALEAWTFEGPDDDRPASGRPALGTLVTFTAAPEPWPRHAVHIVWCGRNNPGDTAREDARAIAESLRRRDPAARYLVLGVPTAAFEPRGTAGHAAVSALDAGLAIDHGDRFVDIAGALLAVGDATCDASAGTNGVTPAGLRSDDVHLNAAGDAVVAAAVLDRLELLGWRESPEE